MPTNNITLDGSGKFQQNAENAGTIKYGEFSQAAINTGNIAVSALFTGTSVNSGTVGGFLPYITSVLVQSNSANWNAAYDALGSYVLNTDIRLSDARVPLSHTQSISTIDGLEDVLTAIQSNGGGAISVTTSDISDFDSAVTALIPVQSVAGKTGTVTLSTSDVTGLQTALDAKQASGSYATTAITTALSSAISGKQAAGSYAADIHTHAIADVTGLQTALDAKQSSGSYATTTAVAALSSAIDGKQASGSYAASVHTHATSDITGFNTAITTLISAAAGVSVASLVNGLIPSTQLPSYVDDVLEYSSYATLSAATGESGKIYVDVAAKKIYRWSGSAYIEISPSPGSTDSVTEGSTNLYFTNARSSAASPVQSVAGKTGTVTLSTSDVAGLASLITSTGGDKYLTSSTSSVVIDNSNGKTITVGTGLAYTSQQDVAIVYNAANHMHCTVVSYNSGTGVMTFDVNSHTGSGTYSQWTVNVGGITSGVTSVAGKTGTVTLSVSDISGAAASSALPSTASTTNWNNTYTAVSQTSATWTSTNFGSISATSVSLDAAMISTYSNPVTANGDFLLLTIGNRQRLIRIWDFA